MEKINKIDEKWSQKYKNSIDCNNPKGFSQRAHCQGKKKKGLDEYKLEDETGATFSPPPHETETYKHIMGIKEIKKQPYDDPTDETEPAQIINVNGDWNKKKKKKVEPKEMTGAASAGAYAGPALFSTTKKGLEEALDASSSGQYTVPAFGTSPKGRKNPLKIDGVKSIGKTRAVKDKNFPKWGGPGSVFIKVKEKCKKYPYCNQGDINAIEVLREDEELQAAIKQAAEMYKLPFTEVEKVVINEIMKIFI